MALHNIVLQDENDEVVKRIEKEYPNNHAVSSTSFLVRTDEISEKVAIKVGIKGDDRINDASGVVFRLNGAYSGYASRALWEWLSIGEGE